MSERFSRGLREMCSLQIEEAIRLIGKAVPRQFFWSKPMNHQSLVQAASIVPPKELAFMFADPPLVGDEKREDFDKLLITIAGAVNPAD
jgi:hypothetical protein